MRDHRRCGADDPATGGGRSVARRCGPQQQRECAILGRSEREPSHHDAVDSTDTHFANHHVYGTTAQRFFHCPEQVASVCDGDRHQPFRCEPKGVETGAMQGAAFGEGHILGDPEQAG